MSKKISELDDSQKEIIKSCEGYCALCKHYKPTLCRPTESSNTWEAWFHNDEEGDCRRYPPVFVGGELDDVTASGDFGSLNWQHPQIYAYCSGCGEYERASWIPKIITGD